MINIFVSSTFKDMHYERDLIHEKVLPQLNSMAAEYGDSVAFCDLRWGVDTNDLDSEEGAKKVLSVCLDEIDRCRPYMIVILGERYGWIPEGSLISETIQGRKDFELDELEKSVTALEIEYGALNHPGQLEKTLFYYREARGPMPEIYRQEDTAHWEKLQELKKRIWKIAGGKVRTYQVHWDEESGRPVGQEQFAQLVTEDMKNLLEQEWQKYRELSDFDRDQLAQWNMVREKSAQFAAREDFVQNCIKELDSGKTLLQIRGAAGSGKSTVMSRLAVCLKEQGKTVLPIFCGHTEMTGSGMSLLHYLTYFLEEQTGNDHLESEKDWNADKCVERLAHMTACYEQSGLPNLFVLIDGADQLPDDEIREQLLFVPGNLSERMKVILSCSDDITLSRARKDVMELAPLDITEREGLVRGMLKFSGRELPEAVICRMVSKKDSAAPLYLNLLLTRLLMMNRNDFEEITDQGDGISAITQHQINILDEMPEDMEQACVEVLRTAAERIGGEMVRAAAEYLAVSRHGLREQDLECLAQERKIPWNSLDFSLFVKYMHGFFIQRKDGRWDFSHKSIRQGFLSQCTDQKKLHQNILTYLEKLPKRDPVRVGELMYHCIRADEKGICVSCIQGDPKGSPGRLAAARDLKAVSLEDGGEWLVGLLRQGENWGAGASFSYFINTEYRIAFLDSLKELKIRERVQTENQIYMEQYVLRFPEKKNKRALSICYEKNANICMEYEDRKHLEKAGVLYEKALALSEELAEETEESRADLAVDRGNLASVYEELEGKEDLQKALKLRISAVDLRKVNADENPSSRNIRAWTLELRNLGLLYSKMDGAENREQGESYLKQACRIQEDLCSRERTRENRDRLIRLMLSLADYYIRTGKQEDIRQARTLCEKALHMRQELTAERNTPESRRALALACSKLGWLYHEKGSQQNLNQAAELYQKAYQIRKDLAEELQTPGSRRELDGICYSLGKLYSSYQGGTYFQKAWDYYLEGIQIAEQLNDEQETTASKKSLGMSCRAAAALLYRQGGRENLLKAVIFWGRRAREIYEDLAEELNTPEIRKELSRCYDLLAVCCRELGDEKYVKQALEWGEKDMELSLRLERELKTLEALDDLGYTCRNLGDLYKAGHPYQDLGKALKLYQKAYDIFREADRRKQTTESMENVQICQECLADICFVAEGLTDVDEAVRMQEEALDTSRKRAEVLKTKESRQDLLRTCLRTGDLYMCLESPEKDWWGMALRLYREAAGAALLNQEENGMQADYDDVAAAASRLAGHPYVPVDERKQHLYLVKTVAGIAAKKCPDPKYSDWISFCERELKELEEEGQ